MQPVHLVWLSRKLKERRHILREIAEEKHETKRREAAESMQRLKRQKSFLGSAWREERRNISSQCEEKLIWARLLLKIFSICLKAEADHSWSDWCISEISLPACLFFSVMRRSACILLLEGLSDHDSTIRSRAIQWSWRSFRLLLFYGYLCQRLMWEKASCAVMVGYWREEKLSWLKWRLQRSDLWAFSITCLLWSWWRPWWPD